MGHPFDIQRRKKGDVVILDLVGDLTLGEPEQLFRDVFAECVSRKQSHLIVNLESVDFMDSSGVGALVKSYTTLTRLGGRMKLLKPGKMIRQTLRITGLLGVLEIWEDELEALASF
jgi:anti-sigma B factor antagonist